MLKVKRVSARRFLSIGDQPVVIDFEKLGPIVNIRGRNRDGGPTSSNGAGKSTVLEMLCFGLTGKLLKGLAHKDIVHHGCGGKGMVIDYEFDLNNKPCRILRKLGPSKLEFWNGDKHYDLGVTETQARINKDIGLSYEALINIAFFGQHNRFAFLNCDPAVKRKIVEALLGLEKYNARCQAVKDKRKDLEKDLQHNFKHYEHWHGQVKGAETRLAKLRGQQREWSDRKAKELATARAGLEGAERDFAGSEAGRAERLWREAQEELKGVAEKLGRYRGQRDKLDDQVEQAVAKRDARKEEEVQAKIEVTQLAQQVRDIKEQIRLADEEAAGLEGVAGQPKCPTCHGKVDRQNLQALIDRASNRRSNLNERLELLARDAEAAMARQEVAQKAYEEIAAWVANSKTSRLNLVKAISQLEGRESALHEVPPPAEDAAGNEARERIAALRADVSRLEDELAEGDPFGPMAQEAETDLGAARTEVDEYKGLISEQEGLLPYYDYWVRGFGDDGIRSLVIGDVINPLNSRVNYWLHFLMNARIRLMFDKRLAETISSNPPSKDPFVYQGMSGGEHQRIDLAISQAFGHLTAMTVGSAVPGFVCLDEVAANVDREGIQCVHRMISELARDRQVIVITHDPDLLELLSGHDTIWVQRESGITRLVQQPAA